MCAKPRQRFPSPVLQGSFTKQGVTVDFKPNWQIQRAGLALTNGNIIVAFGSRCFHFNQYNGWVFSVNPEEQKVTGIWMSVLQNEGGDGAGIWGGGVIRFASTCR
jgi:hypothetical protein